MSNSLIPNSASQENPIPSRASHLPPQPSLKDSVVSEIGNRVLFSQNGMKVIPNASREKEIFSFQRKNSSQSEPERNNPLLATLWAKKRLSSDFRLSQKDEELIVKLFANSRGLDRHLVLFDLIGMELLSSFKKIFSRVEFGNRSARNETMDSLSNGLMDLYLHAKRKLAFPGHIEPDGEKEVFKGSESEIVLSLAKCSQSLDQLPIPPDFLPEFEKERKTIKDLLGLLFRAVSQSNQKESSRFLMGLDLSLFEFSDQILGTAAETLDKVIGYVDYQREIFEKGFEVGDIFLSFAPFYSSLQKSLLGLKNSKLNREKVNLFKKELAELIPEAYISLFMKIERDYERSRQGELNYKKWNEEHKIENSEEKSDSRFQQELLKNKLANDLFILFLQDVKRILDDRCFQKTFDRFYPSLFFESRLGYNLVSFSVSMENRSKLPIRPLIQRHLTSMFGCYLEEASHFRISKWAQDKRIQLGIVSNWGMKEKSLISIDCMKDLTALESRSWERVVREFPAQKELFYKELQTDLGENRNEGEIEKIRNEIVQFLIPVVSMRICSSDARSLSGHDYFFEKRDLIDPLLFQLMSLKGISDPENRFEESSFLSNPNSQIEAEEEEGEKPFSDSNVPSSLKNDSENSGDLPDPQEMKEPFFRFQKTSPPLQRGSSDPSSVFERSMEWKEPFIETRRKTEKILRELYRLPGCSKVGGKGSHQVFKLNKEGPPVVVPTNEKELPQGTFHSVIKQIDAALAFQDSKENRPISKTADPKKRRDQ